MNLAPIVAICLIGMSSTRPGPLTGRELAASSFFLRITELDTASLQTNNVASSSPSQSTAAQTAQTPPTTSAPVQKTAGSSKPPATAHRRKKKTAPDCSTEPTPLNPAVSASKQPDATKGNANAGEPCSPAKKVINNGGSNEPQVQLKGPANSPQASPQHSTDELATAEENLKKIEGQQLNAGQQEMVTQIKRFMEQSKTAVAEGDAERGHNLAMKARMLSDELVKP
jgi:hypothetical protein